MVCSPAVNVFALCGALEDETFADDSSVTSHGSDRAPLTVDDMESTLLFEAIQQSDWGGVDFFLEKGTFSYSPFHKDKRLSSPREQAETWIICKDPEGKIIWRQLPLHAAICYGAPVKTVKGLLAANPRAARCIDNEGNLPLHLAVKFNRSDDVLEAILREYPKAIQIRNDARTKPLDNYQDLGDGEISARFEVIQTFTGYKKAIAAREEENMRKQIHTIRQSTKKAKEELAEATKELKKPKRAVRR